MYIVKKLALASLVFLYSINLKKKKIIIQLTKSKHF